MGTAFLGCPEAAVPEVHRSALHGAADEDTRRLGSKANLTAPKRDFRYAPR